MTGAVPLVPGRSCDGCTMCCKLMRVAALDKPRGQWCVHCDIGAGCKIYDRRPEACLAFYCAYRLTTELDERWKPALSHLLVRYDERRISVFVDADDAKAWKREPYFTQIKTWAAQAAPHRGQVIVWRGLDAYAIFPDREKFLGPVREDQRMVNAYTQTPQGERMDVVVMDASDPRIAGSER